MSDEIVTISGLDELQRNLENLAEKVQGEVVTKAARAGANVVKKAVAAAAPRHSGFLADHISVSVKKQRGEAGAATALVFPNKKVVYPR